MEVTITMKKLLATGLMLAFALSILPAASQAAPQKKKDKEKAKQDQKGPVYIPKEVKAIIEEGLPTRQGRQDLAFNLFKYYVLPAQVNFHTVFLFKAKNAEEFISYRPGDLSPSDLFVTG